MTPLFGKGRGRGGGAFLSPVEGGENPSCLWEQGRAPSHGSIPKKRKGKEGEKKTLSRCTKRRVSPCLLKKKGQKEREKISAMRGEGKRGRKTSLLPRPSPGEKKRRKKIARRQKRGSYATPGINASRGRERSGRYSLKEEKGEGKLSTWGVIKDCWRNDRKRLTEREETIGWWGGKKCGVLGKTES